MPARVGTAFSGLSVSHLLCLFSGETVLVKGRRAWRRWSGVLRRQKLNARPVLVYPAIPDVDGDAEAMGEVASGGG